MILIPPLGNLMSIQRPKLKKNNNNRYVRGYLFVGVQGSITMTF